MIGALIGMKQMNDNSFIDLGESDMKSVVTSKFQTTIPEAVRDYMNLSENDTLEWNILDGKIIVTSSSKNFLKHQNTIKTGRGDISKDIESARNRRVEKYR